MDRFHRVVSFVSRVSDRIGQFFLAAVVILVAANIVGRTLRIPIYGAFELSSYMQLVYISLAVALCHLNKGHIAVGVFVERLSPRTQAIIENITGIVSLILFSLVAWSCGKLAVITLHSGRTMEAFPMIPSFPVYVILTFGILWFCLTLLIDVYESMAEVLRR